MGGAPCARMGTAHGLRFIALASAAAPVMQRVQGLWRDKGLRVPEHAPESGSIRNSRRPVAPLGERRLLAERLGGSAKGSPATSRDLATSWSVEIAEVGAHESR